MPEIELIYASRGIIKLKTTGCIMRTRKPRVDIKDISGMKFGDLTVIRLAEPGKYRGSRWKCKCDCGNECEVYGGHLRDGTRKSCGCRSQARIFETGINRVFCLYKRKAKERSKEFSITREELGELVKQNCFYCGNPPENEIKRQKTKKTQIVYSGIDRFNPDIGYTKENCVPCCYYCNHSKLDLSFDQWKEHLRKIYNFQGFTNGNR